jgi:hypothetical protein
LRPSGASGLTQKGRKPMKNSVLSPEKGCIRPKIKTPKLATVKI